VRRELRDELSTRVAQSLPPGVSLGAWRGDPRDFDDAPEGAPAVWLAYAGGVPGSLGGRGRSVWDRDVIFAVYVYTTEEEAADPEGRALDLLDAVELGLVNWKPPNAVMVEPLGEEDLQRVVLGRHLYGQRYRVKGLVSQLSP